METEHCLPFSFVGRRETNNSLKLLSNCAEKSHGKTIKPKALVLIYCIKKPHLSSKLFRAKKESPYQYSLKDAWDTNPHPQPIRDGRRNILFLNLTLFTFSNVSPLNQLKLQHNSYYIQLNSRHNYYGFTTVSNI